MKKEETVSLASILRETKEAWRAPGAEEPSFNTLAVSLTSLHSFADDLGYQGSQELTSEEEPGLASQRQKRSKVAARRPRKDEGKEEEEQEEDEADSARAPGRPPRPRRKLPGSWRARPLGQAERPSTRESSAGSLASRAASPRWSLAGFRRYLCGCCGLPGSGPDEPAAAVGGPPVGPLGRQARRRGAPGGAPRRGPARSREHPDRNPL